MKSNEKKLKQKLQSSIIFAPNPDLTLTQDKAVFQLKIRAILFYQYYYLQDLILLKEICQYNVVCQILRYVKNKKCFFLSENLFLLCHSYVEVYEKYDRVKKLRKKIPHPSCMKNKNKN